MKTSLTTEQSRHLRKRCNKCGREFTIDFFHKSNSGKYGVMAVCKDCRTKKKLSIIPNLQDETWLPITGYEGLYEISNKGRVKSFHKGESYAILLNPHRDLHGYLKVCLTKDKISKYKFVHRLIAEAFIPNPENKPYIDHINRRQDDNHLENLRWVTHKENMNNPNTITNFKEVRAREEIFNKQWQSQPKRRPIDMLSLKGEYIKSFPSIKQAAKYVNRSPTSIVKCCNGICESAYSFKWRFSNIDKNHED